MTALFTQIKLNINGLLDTGADEAEAVLFWWFDLNMYAAAAAAESGL